MTDPVRKCPKCGGELPADAPAGLCPKCLLEAGLASDTGVGASEGAPTTPHPGSPGFVPLSPAELATHFPQLEILELIGAGGMGAVYKALQPGLNRLVAVKILPPEIGADPVFAQRFTREAQALAKLGHQHIVTVYDFGVVDGLCYFIMEYVDGTNLRRLIKTGQLRPAEALAIVPADLRGAAIRPRRRHRSSGHQAGKHSRRPAGPREDRRLRPGPVAR